MSSSPVHTQRLTLRILGTSVTLLETLRQRAEQDLGIQVEYQLHTMEDAHRIAVTQPESYDVLDLWFHHIDFIWPAQAIQPLDISRLKYWDEVNSLPKTGTLNPGQLVAAGSVPSELLYVQQNGQLSSRPTGHISMLPLTHGVDSFAYHENRLPAVLKHQEESWGWLLHPALSGQVAMQEDAIMGGLDASLALQAAGLSAFRNPTNLTLREIDHLTAELTALKKKGQFATFWSTQDEACSLIDDENVEAQTLWAPIYFRRHYQQHGYRMARPKEGYRAWFGGMGLSRCVSGRIRDAAYAYLNWWQSGWPGAVMARQGFYISNPAGARRSLSIAEWDFWYGGQPAAEVLYGVTGEALISPGEIRVGGSYEDRMSHIAVWNSVMDEHNYLTRRWHDFLRACNAY